MPFVDLNTKKIYGCKKGSRAYFHESGHIKFSNSEYGNRISYYHYFFTMIAVAVIPFNFFVTSWLLKIFSLLCSLGVISTYLIEEIWCEIYARKMIRHK